MPELKNCLFNFLDHNRIELRQDREEIMAASEYLSSQTYDLLIEVGVLHGGSAIILSALLKPESTIILVDPLNRGQSARISFKRSCDWLEEQKFKVFPVIGMSYDPKVQEKVRLLAQNFDAGLLHIDGDHATQSVLLDYRAFLGCLGSKGAIMLHDVVENPRVKVAWDILCVENENHKVFYYGHKSMWSSGVGVLKVQ